MDLDQCRKDINSIDKDILDLLVRRRAISRKVIEDKIEKGLPLRDAVREGGVLETLIKAGRKLEVDAHFVQAMTKVWHLSGCIKITCGISQIVNAPLFKTKQGP